MIIGLCGSCGAGKDTVGDILASEYGFIKLSFATALKDVVSIIFSWPREMLEGATPESRIWRETVDVFWSEKTKIEGFTPRKALQIVGTNLLRNQLYKDIWIDIVENKITKIIETNPESKIVITDCRFDNEINLIRKFSNAHIFQVRRPNHTITEDINYDFVIQNDNSIEDLKIRISYLLKTV